MWKERVWKGSLILALWALLVFGWMKTPPHLAGKVDAVGYAVCHRIPSHSFQVGGRPLALCARCTGQYLGLMLGLIYLALWGKRRAGTPPWVVIAVMVVSALAYAVDGLNSLFHYSPQPVGYTLYVPRNELRLISGLGMGLDIAIVTHLLFHYTVWKRPSLQPPVRGIAGWVGLYAAGGVLVLAVLSGDPRVLWPLSWVSALGVLTLLTLLYALIWIILFQRSGSFSRIQQLTWFFLGGLITAIAQITAVGLLRFWATGTWSGFHLG